MDTDDMFTIEELGITLTAFAIWMLRSLRQPCTGERAKELVDEFIQYSTREEEQS